jgi:hypothetical protein
MADKAIADWRDARARPVMSALPPRAMPDDLALVCVLEASIAILKTENEILKRRLAAGYDTVNWTGFSMTGRS